MKTTKVTINMENAPTTANPVLHPSPILFFSFLSIECILGNSTSYCCSFTQTRHNDESNNMAAEKFDNQGAAKNFLEDVDRACYKHVKELDPLFQWPSQSALNYNRMGATLNMRGGVSMEKLRTNINDAMVKLNALYEELAIQSANLSTLEARLDVGPGPDGYLAHLDWYDSGRQGGNTFWPGIGGLNAQNDGQFKTCEAGVKDALWLWNLSNTKRNTSPITAYVAPRGSYMVELVRIHKTMNYTTHVPPKLTDVDRFSMMLSIAHYIKKSDRMKPKKREAEKKVESNSKKPRVEHEDDDE